MQILKNGKYFFHLSWLIGSLAGCGGSQERLAPDETYTVYDGEEVIILSSKIESCSYIGFSQSVVIQDCFSTLNAGTRFETYSNIVGFEPRWGTTQELLVEYWQSPHEIADAPLVMVKLKQVISQQEDPAGSRYDYFSVNLPFTFDQNQRFLNHSWTCGLDEGCTWIFASADPVDLTFEKKTDGSMLLIEATVAPNQDETL
jgi:hypothetical protein